MFLKKKTENLSGPHTLSTCYLISAACYDKVGNSCPYSVTSTPPSFCTHPSQPLGPRYDVLTSLCRSPLVHPSPHLAFLSFDNRLRLASSGHMSRQFLTRWEFLLLPPLPIPPRRSLDARAAVLSLPNAATP